MAGEHDKLRETINRLQAQVDELRQRDPAVAEHLLSTLAEVKAVLGGEPTQPAQHRSLMERLSNAVLKYETSHPVLAGGLGKIIDALGQMGI
ncbi:MAG: DUF4404 family protein [Planctomycetia bacterium]|nr:DUF4404 family protein [Planctomycetia bacterium]